MTDSLSAIRHLIHPIDGGAMCPPTEIYRSAKGDMWELFKAADSTRSMVRYTPASGDAPTLVSVEEFLAVTCSGPEHAALRILLANPSADKSPE